MTRTPSQEEPLPPETNPYQDFEKVIEALLDEKHHLPFPVYRRLSDLEGAEADRLRAIWPQISRQRRRNLLEELEVLTEVDYTLSYLTVGLVAMDDPDGYIRALGIRLLWEEEEPFLAERFLTLVTEDPDPQVRATAAGALGSYVYLGEVEELSPRLFQRIVETLIGIVRDASLDAELRRQALEAVSYATHEEVPGLIEAALAEEDLDWQAAALYAMGRSGLRRWGATIMEYLEHPNPRLRAEAATAAGQLGLGRAVKTLTRLLEDTVPEVRMAAAWALGEIGKGGDTVYQALEKALELAADEEEVQAIEEAQENFVFQAGLMDELLLMDIGEGEVPEEDLEEWLDLFGDEDEDKDSA
ncbi:MAG TPA: hypothetical protein G4O04_11055 [Anaerolineae bacterium]|nr:hypothetical protein [Anaerolineae bacterium]